MHNRLAEFPLLNGLGSCVSKPEGVLSVAGKSIGESVDCPFRDD